MPIFQHPTRGRVLFIHIPKTGGSSIEAWLRSHGYTLDKINTWDGPTNQHAPREVYSQWGHFDYKFTVVREPLTRFISTLGFRMIHAVDGERIATEILDSLHRNKLEVNWGNHFQPQVDFIDDDVEIFKFEENFFHSVSGALKILGPFPHENKSRTTVAAEHLSDKTIARIRQRYQQDYNTFGYEIQT